MTEDKQLSGGAHTTAVIIQIGLFIGILTVGVFIAQALFNKTPEAPRKPRPRQARLVQVEPAAVKPYQIELRSLGTVMPAKSSVLQMEVAGRIQMVAKDVFPGNAIKKDQVLLSIDDRQYKNALQQRLAELAAARKEYKLESGNSAVAQREFELTGVEIKPEERDLVLRLPQLEAAKAAMEAAQLRVDQARIDLERCQLKAPYDAIVTEKLTDVGEMVSSNTSLMKVVGSHVFWIEALISEADMKWLNQGDGQVQIMHPSVWGADKSRDGKVLRVLPQLEENGRMARVLVAVNEPLDKPSLFIDSVVDMNIHGPKIEKYIVVPSAYVHEDNHVWIAQDGKLRIKHIKILWRNQQDVVVAEGLKVGDLIITSPLSAVTDGLDIQVEGSDSTNE